MVLLAPPPLFAAPLPAAAADDDGPAPTPRRAADLAIADDARAANMIVCMMGCGMRRLFHWRSAEMAMEFDCTGYIECFPAAPRPASPGAPFFAPPDQKKKTVNNSPHHAPCLALLFFFRK